MLATDPFILAKFPKFLASDDELRLTAELLGQKTDLCKAFREFVCIGGDIQASLRRFCWQAKQDNLAGQACAEEAVSLISKCVDLRTRLRLDTILETPSFDDDFWSLFKKTVSQTYHGTGKRGQPIVVIRLGLIDPEQMDKLLDAGKACGVGELNAAVLCFLRCEDFLLRKQVLLESERVGHLTDRIILVLDLWGLGMSHFRVLKDFMLVAVKHMVSLYPETLDKMVVTNAAWVMSRLIWPLVKQVLHPVTQAKISMYDASTSRNGLLEIMDERALPSFCGGTTEDVHLGHMLEEANGSETQSSLSV